MIVKIFYDIKKLPQTANILSYNLKSNFVRYCEGTAEIIIVLFKLAVKQKWEQYIHKLFSPY